MSRGKFIGMMLAGLVFAVGALTLVQQFGAITAYFAETVVTNQKTYSNTNGSQSPSAPDQPTDVKAANFAYLVPGSSAAWKQDDGQSAFDPAKGIVKYGVTFTNAKVGANVTQQVFPDQLKPRGGDKFRTFIANANPARSADLNGGTLYFLAALKNGVQANGTDTVIFARDDILMFGQARGILGWDAWTQMVSSMKPILK